MLGHLATFWLPTCSAIRSHWCLNIAQWVAKHKGSKLNEQISLSLISATSQLLFLIILWLLKWVITYSVTHNLVIFTFVFSIQYNWKILSIDGRDLNCRSVVFGDNCSTKAKCVLYNEDVIIPKVQPNLIHPKYYKHSQWLFSSRLRKWQI